MNIDYTTYIKPELLVLIPVLVFIGYFLKQSEAVKDKLIPAILAAVGVLLAALWVLATLPLLCLKTGLWPCSRRWYRAFFALRAQCSLIRL